jgi:hypothetical protein
MKLLQFCDNVKELFRCTLIVKILPSALNKKFYGLLTVIVVMTEEGKEDGEKC